VDAQGVAAHEQGVPMAAVESLFQRELTDDRWMNDGACKGSPSVLRPTGRTAQARDRREAMARTVVRELRVHHICQEFARTKPMNTASGAAESEDERHTAGYRLIAPIGVRARTSLSNVG